MHRRSFLAGSVSVLAVPLAAAAQPAGKVYRLAILSNTARPDPSVATSATLVPVALRDLGYIEGQNLVIERRFADGKIDRLRAFARELVAMRVDVIVAVSEEAIQAAKDVTTTTPIVMGFGSDPVEHGFVASLARPGGNITGVLVVPAGQLTAKRLELLKEAVPRAARIAVLATNEATARTQLQEAQKAAPPLGVKLVVVQPQGTDYASAFGTMMADRADALLVLASVILNRDGQQIIERAAHHRLPAMWFWRGQVEVGGLMSYGTSLVALCRRVADYVDKILRGAKPADLPIEQPTKFELVINMKTAKTLGLTIPQSVLLRADLVVE